MCDCSLCTTKEQLLSCSIAVHGFLEECCELVNSINLQHTVKRGLGGGTEKKEENEALSSSIMQMFIKSNYHVLLKNEANYSTPPSFEPTVGGKGAHMTI